MNIFWDMRLYSYGYGTRGIGTYCTHTAAALLSRMKTASFYLWGDPDSLPEQLLADNVTILPYTGGSWKKSIVDIPYLVLKHRIDLVHYWVALGPLSSIGISPVPFASAIGTIHDLAVELWHTPFGNSVRQTSYWKLQKLFIRSVDGLLCNSRATLNDVNSVFSLSRPSSVTYPPVPPSEHRPAEPSSPRQPFFITLGGSPHKNCRHTVEAFTQFRKTFPDFKLKILGQLDSEEEGLTALPDGVEHEPTLKNYRRYLAACSGLLSLSYHEGLGLPPLEAMSFSCPLLLSDIPSHHEICRNAALFADPNSTGDIAQKMTTLTRNNDLWVNYSRNGALQYHQIAAAGVDRCILLYDHFTPGMTRRGNQQ
jgi:glycosyltransferase involved in cell wall biosynthesis